MSDKKHEDLTDAEWYQLTVAAREIEIEDRKSNFDRSRPPLLVAVDQRILRWAHRRLNDLEQAVRELASYIPNAKEPRAGQGRPKHSREQVDILPEE